MDPVLQTPTPEIAEGTAQGNIQNNIESNIKPNISANITPAGIDTSTAEFESTTEATEEAINLQGTVKKESSFYYVSSPVANIRKAEEPHAVDYSKGFLAQGTRVELQDTFVNSKNELLAKVEDLEACKTYWVSKKTLTITERTNDKTVYWSPASGKFSLAKPFNVKKKLNALSSDARYSVVEKCGEYVLINDGQKDVGWVKQSEIFTAPKDSKENFSFEDVPDWTSLETVDEATLKIIQKNRNSINDRFDQKTYATVPAAQKKGGHMYSNGDKYKPDENLGGDTIDTKIKKVILKEVMGEGSYSSINTWDKQYFTFGRGFASGGGLEPLLKKIVEKDPKYKKIFLNFGIMVVNGQIVVVDDAGKVTANDTAKKNYVASKLIAGDKKLISFFMELGEKKEYGKEIAQIQYDTLLSNLGKYPAYIADKENNKFADEWNESSVSMLAHLTHWCCYGWSNDYSDTKGNIPKILYTYIYNSVRLYAAARNGLYANNVYSWWTENLGLLTSLKAFGSPKGVGYTNYIATWGDSNLKELEIKDNKVYLKGEKKVLKNVVIVKEGAKYRVITPVGDTLDSHIEEEK